MPPVNPLVFSALGGWDLGICGDLILQGVIFAQIAHYFNLYRSDVPALRAFVFGLLFLTTLRSMQMIAIMWVQNVEYFTDIDGAVGMFFSHWLMKISVAFGASISFYVQMFLCHRLWVLSKNLYVVALLLFVFIFALVAALILMAFTFNISTSQDLRNTFLSLHVGVVFGGDLLLCLTTAYFLLKTSKQVLPQTAGMLNAILKLTFQTAAPGAVCAMINLITSRLASTPNPYNTSLLISVIATDILPKIYALSAMWTLNSRRSIRVGGSSGQDSSTEGPSGGRRTGTSGGRGGVELGTFGKVQRIQVRTQVQTAQHTDEDGAMFGKDDADLKSRGMEEASVETDKRVF
ncbi:hypothetical protein MIND_00530300 [Mycena indigotica]|uniref:DUF6534 domain-containing protein n=1 Tax=Mycena indigotica TaxID=2126181 RepID=A0A8H6SZV8_9AGAR|nr:uncharacterized protein MIND_00530300 [Mycena indigotica]KAF7307362.1 hypothetical protein MIND_00530300 [Mycena indigotica]